MNALILIIGFIIPLVSIDNIETQARNDVPVINAEQRVTVKPFGIKVSPNNSPVKPEKFTGYHSGVDYEILPGEENRDVSVQAICDGEIKHIRSAQGYGGVLLQSCNLKDEPVTVIYGHLKLSSISQQPGDSLRRGQSFAILGDAFSNENGDERKHLHLGIHKGSEIDWRGYVQNENELNEWIDFEAQK